MSDAAFEALEVSTDLSGGVRIRLGGRFTIILSPDQAIQFGSAVLRTAGCNVELNQPAVPIIRPAARLPS